MTHEPFYELPKENNYGGVAVFVKSNLHPLEKPDLKMTKQCSCSNCCYENVWVECKKNDFKCIVGGIYRHPGGDLSHFNSDMDSCLSKTANYNSALWAGDVNIDIIQQHANNLEYVSTLATHGLLPYITRPTRITDHCATLIDHIFIKCKEADRPLLSGNFFCAITDHLPNFVIIDIGKNYHAQPERHFTRIFSENNMLRFAAMISDIDWITEFETYDDIDDICKFFMFNLKRFSQECFPLKRISKSKAKDKPWMTQGLKKCIRRKNHLYVLTLNNCTDSVKKKYIDYKLFVEDLIDKAQLMYYSDVFNNRKNSVKLLWDEFGPILGKKGTKNHKGIRKLIIDKKTFNEPLDIANAINKHFCEIGPKLASCIKNEGSSFRDYLNDPSEHNFFLKAVVESDVLEELLKLNHRKSAGPDGLSPKLIKACSYSLYKPLTYIFNKSISSATYPQAFKTAKLIPLYKAEKRCDPSNYRPISLLNCFDKIFEKLINRQLMDYLRKNNLLYEYQYSFREGYSTDLALLIFNDYIKKEIDKGNFVLTLFIDLKKAFDTVNHLILTQKMDYYGIRGHCNMFFKSYLSNRKQYVHCNNVDSNVENMTCGVPQGSVLGPTLFLLYINDMINCIRYSRLQLFADDTITSVSGKNLNILFNLIRHEIKLLKKWFSANMLSLNVDKTFYSVFHSRKSIVSDVFNSITVDGMTIKRKKSAKYLGLTFDEVLSWRHHVEDLLKGLSKYFHFFYHLRKVIPYKFKLQLFHAYVYSKVTYGLHCYGAANDIVLDSVQIVCNKLLKILLIKDRDFPTDKLYKTCKLLKVNDQTNFLATKFVHRSIYPNDYTPEQLSYYFKLNIDVHDRDVRDKLKIRLPQVKTALGGTCLHWYGSFYWNSLDLELRKMNNFDVFKKLLKEHILNQYCM